MVKKLKLADPGWLTFNDLCSKRQIIALTNGVDRLGETYIFPGYERPGSILRSFSAGTSDPKILLDRLDENASQLRGDKLWYLGTQMTPGIDIVTNPAIFNPALLIAGAMDPFKALLRFMAGQSTSCRSVREQVARFPAQHCRWGLYR
jgi:hypothetical protein